MSNEPQPDILPEDLMADFNDIFKGLFNEETT
jgi:hypothetical protein